VRAAWIIARKEIAQRLRDRSFFIIGLAAPFILALIFNLVLGGVINGEGDLNLRFGVVDRDSGPVSDGFMQMLEAIEEGGLATITVYDSVAAAEAAVDDDEVSAAFILSDTLSANVLLGAPAEFRILGNVDSSISTSIAAAIAEQFARTSLTFSVGTRAGIAAGVIDPAAISDVIANAQDVTAAFALSTTEVRSRQLGSATFFVAGLGMFFVYFVAGMAIASLLEERSNGTLSRLLVAPISPSSIVAGKSAASVGLGVMALVFLAIASTLIMGANWGNPLMTGLILVAAVIAVSGVMMLVGGLARTAEQAQSLQAIVGVTMAMLGGTFVPITSDGGFIASLRYLTPNAWYISGLGDVVGGAYGAAFQAVLVLLAIGIVTGGAGLMLVRRTLSP